MRFRVLFLLFFLSPVVQVDAQSPRTGGTLSRALLDEVHQAAGQAKGAALAVDVEHSTLDQATRARIQRYVERLNKSSDLLTKSAQRTATSPSILGHTVLLLQFVGLERSVDSLSTELQLAVNGASPEMSGRLGDWATGLSKTADNLLRVVERLEPVVLDAAEAADARLRRCPAGRNAKND